MTAITIGIVIVPGAIATANGVKVAATAIDPRRAERETAVVRSGGTVMVHGGTVIGRGERQNANAATVIDRLAEAHR